MVFAVTTLLVVGGCQTQRTFNTPEDAVTALNSAVEQQNKAELLRIFGPDAEELKSGDPEQDHDDAVIFTRRLKTAHKVRMDSPDHATLLIGQDQWPFAVPLILEKNKWRFDTSAGLEELTNRRIGRNELLTIAACNTLIDAQKEFYDRDPDALGVKHYAQRLMSSPDKKDGLYWPAPGGVDPSPIGPALAYAATRRDEQGERIPFNGYLYKPLLQQAASAPGGAIDYRENGQLTRGWAVIAYPADYGTTGIISFICSSGGVVYQKDLGDDTQKTAESMEAFDPTGWDKAATTGSAVP
jgi:hypothetical protein